MSGTSEGTDTAPGDEVPTGRSDIMTELLQRTHPRTNDQWLDEPWWTALCVVVWLLVVSLRLDIGGAAPALVGLLLALLAIAASSPMTTIPVLIGADLGEGVSSARAVELLEGFLAVQWINLRWLLAMGFAAFSGATVAMLAPIGWEYLPNSIAVPAATMGVLRFWLLVKGSFKVFALLIQLRLPSTAKE